jgi:hypothetical protein
MEALFAPRAAPENAHRVPDVMRDKVPAEGVSGR